MHHNRQKIVVNIFLIASLLLGFISRFYGFISVYNSYGLEEAKQSTNFILLVIPLLYVYLVYKNYKLNNISIFILFSYLLFKVAGIGSIKVLFTMFFWKYFSLQPYLYYLSSWLIPLFSLIGVIIQIKEYRRSSGNSGSSNG